jgi:hypothetical protein
MLLVGKSWKSNKIGINKRKTVSKVLERLQHLQFFKIIALENQCLEAQLV